MLDFSEIQKVDSVIASAITLSTFFFFFKSERKSTNMIGGLTFDIRI